MFRLISAALHSDSSEYRAFGGISRRLGSRLGYQRPFIRSVFKAVGITRSFPQAGFLHGEGGATAIEYAMIGAMIGLVIVGAMQTLGQRVSSLYNAIAAAF